MIFDGKHVFDCDRNSEQAPCGTTAFGEFFVRRVGLRKRVSGVVADEGVNFSIHTRDLVEARLHRLTRGDFAFGELDGEFGNGELVQHENPTTDEHG
jgi:hypothetical protein